MYVITTTTRFICLNHIEPVGSVAPKVNVADKVSISSTRQGHVTNILCPSQGYPMPAFRYFNITIIFQESLKLPKNFIHEFFIIFESC